MDIKELIEGCKKWQKTAQNELYDAFSPRMYAICLRYMGNADDAQDALQESFIKIFKSFHNYVYKDDASFYAWIHKITVNTALNQIRSNNKNKNTIGIEVHANEMIDESDYDNNYYDDIIEQIGSRELFRHIQELPDGYRTVFNMYVVEDFAHKEISEMLGISINTSKTQLFKARKMLHEQILAILNKTIIKEVV